MKQVWGSVLLSALLLPFLLHAVNEQYKVLHNPKTGKRMAYSALAGDNGFVTVPVRYQPKRNEMRGIWITTYANLDFTVSDTPYTFKKKYPAMLAKVRAAGFNAVFFQIRPSCDAFYNSSIVPFSKMIRGREGVGFTQFDMLQFMIQEAHRQGLQFHAWLNPYRVVGSTGLSKAQYLKTLAPNNFARLHPECVMCSPAGKGNMLILDPGMPLVRQHIQTVIREIITKYTPDAIIFDDYFYPYNYTGSADAGTYRKYNRNPRMTLEQWRRNNINQMVYETSVQIRANNTKMRKRIQFGISPFGIWLNRKSIRGGSPTLGMESYRSNYSDTLLWIQKRWIDYVVPQLYWQFDHPKAPYACLADWWANQVSGTGVKLYIGIGAYLPVAANNTSEFKNQMLFNQRRYEIAGTVFYSWRHVFHPESKANRQAMEQVIRDCWKRNLPR